MSLYRQTARITPPASPDSHGRQGSGKTSSTWLHRGAEKLLDAPVLFVGKLIELRRANARARRRAFESLRRTVVWLLIIGIVLGGTPGFADTRFWTFDNTGTANWTTTSNWQGGFVPNSVGDIAVFRNNITVNRVVTLDAPITLGGLELGDALGAQTFTFAGSATNTLTLDNLGGANAFVSKFGSATDLFQAPLVLNDDVNWNIYTGTMRVTGPSNAQVSYTGSGDTIKNGAGTLQLNIDAVSGAGYTGNWIVNFGTLSIGGPNVATSTALGTGTGGIQLNGTGRADLAIFALNNSGTASDSTVTYSGNNDVFLQGGARIAVDRNAIITGAFDRVTHVLDNLTLNGGILSVTSANGHRLRFDGTTTLVGHTASFDVGTNSVATLSNLTLAGVITDGANSRAVIKEGSGRMTIANTANTYDGITAIKDGVLGLAAGANVGTGGVLINGGALSVPDTATLDAVSATAGGLNLVAQLGTSRYALPVVAYSGSVAIDGTNPFDVDVPIAGMVLAIDGVTGTSSINTANIDLSEVAGGSNRVWLGNLIGFDRTYRGTLTNGVAGDLRLLAGSNNLILDTTTNILGGGGATNNLIFGFDHANAILFTGNQIIQATSSTQGTVSVRVNNSATLGTVTVNRGVTVNINGAVNTPLGAGTVTALGGQLTTDNASAAQLGNQNFLLFGGSTLLLDNRGVAAATTDRRLLSNTSIQSVSSTFSFAVDGGAANVQTQTINNYLYSGRNIINIGRDGVVAGSRAELTIGGDFTRENRGTITLGQLDAQAATLGTAAGTSKILLGTAPTVTNDMIGAYIALYGGANMQDTALPLFVTYDGTHGIQAATFDLAPTTAAALQAATAVQIVDFNNVNGTTTLTGAATMQALRLRTTVNTQVLASGSNVITIGSSAAGGQGAGLQLVHTANNEVTHTANFAFGSQEALIYMATTGGTSGIIRLNGNLTGSNGVTFFGDGRVRLGGANNFGGPITINSGDVRFTSATAAGPTSGTPSEIALWGGILSLNGSTRHNSNITFYNDARLSNDNAGGATFNNLTFEARSGSTAPVVAWIQAVSGSQIMGAYGGLTLNGDAQFSIVHGFQINGPISGTGNLERFMNERLYLGGDSSGYNGNLTAYAGSFMSLNSSSTAKPFGTGAVTLNPGSWIRLAAHSNIDASQLVVNSDLGGISGVGFSYVGDPTTLPAFTINSTASGWRGAVGIGTYGFRTNINQATLWGGDVYLGTNLGDTGTYTGTLTPANGGRYLLGTGQGTIRIARPLTGSGNRAVIGISMAGDDLGRAAQTVNNSGGTVEYVVPMTYDGPTIINPNGTLRVVDRNALVGTGDIYLNGGILQPDSTVGQLRMIAPLTIGNNIVLTADSSINLQNNPSDLILTGDISLGPGSTGVVRQIFFGVDQPGAAANNAGNVYLEGDLIDGMGGSGNHFIKAGAGTLFLKGVNTYSGTTTVSGGLLAINSMDDFGNTSGINLPGGGLAIWENSVTLTRNVSVHGGSGYFDVLAGMTLTQDASSTIDGTSGIIKRGLGTMVLNGNNAQSFIFAMDGVLQANSQASLGNPAESSNDRIQFGGDLTIGSASSATRYTGGTLRLNFTGATNRGFQFNNNGNTTFGGGIDVTAGNTFTINGVISQGTEFDYGFITGAGTLVTTGTNTWRQFAMTNGTWQFGNSAPWANSTATAADNTIIEMIGGTIRAVNTGANIALANNVSTTTYNYGGGMHLRMASGTGFSVEFAADNLLRVNQGTLVLETEGSTLLGGAGATNAGRVVVTNAINSAVARASATTNGIFAAHLIGADAAGSAFFLENDAATGFKAFSGVGTLASLAGLNPNSIAHLAADEVLTGTSNSIYALRTANNISGGTLAITAIDNLRSGGILINGSSTIGSNLIFDPTAVAPGTGIPGEALVYVKTGENATISGNVTTNAFTKFGRGTLTLSGTNAIFGDVSVQDGVLKLGGNGGVGRIDAELNVNSGAQLDLNGTSIVVETLSSNNREIVSSSLSGNQFGGAIVNTSGTQATLRVTGTNSGSFRGTIGTGIRLVRSGTGVLTLGGYSSSTPDAGNNTHAGTDLYGQSYSITGGGTTSGSANVTVPSTAGLVPGMYVQGTNIPAGAYIVSITNATTFVLSTTASATGSSLTFTAFGGITVNNSAFALGGFNNAATGDVNLYSGTLNLLYTNGNTGVNGTHGQHFNNQVIKLGAESTDGVTLNVRGNVLINVNSGATSSAATWGQGNILQVGDLNMTGATLQLSGANLYRLRVAGTTTLLGGQAAFQTNTDGPSGALELTGQITGGGALNKLVDGGMRGIIISNTSNNYSGGTNIIGGDVSVTATSNALGTGAVRVFPDGTLRVTANTSVNGNNLTVMSRVSAFGAVNLTDNFNPTFLTAANFGSAYGTTLQLGVPFFTQALNMATIGDGRAFLGSGLAQEVRYMGATLGAGVADDWNPGVGVYRVVGGVNNFTFEGVDNVFTGNAYLQVGPQRNMVLGAVTNSGNAVFIRNSNDYTGGTQIAEGTVVISEVGGSPIGETPVGSGAVEVYGEYRIQGSLGSNWKADANGGLGAATNTINLRPGGLIRLIDGNLNATGGNLVAGGQGRWGDAVGVDLNGGQFRLDGALNWNTVETIGDVTARKGGIITVVRNNTNSSSQLNIDDLSRAERGVLTLNYNTGFLGINVTTPLSYERVTVQSIDGAAVVRGGTTTNGAGVSNPGIVAPWIIDRLSHTFVGYDPTGASTGFQPLLSAAPGAGQLAYNKIVSGALTAGGLAAGDIADITTGAKTLADNPTLYAMRSNQNISPTGVNNTITLTSGGLILSGGTINPVGAITAGVVSPMTLNFGAAGAGEAFVYASTTSTIYAAVNAAQGLTKFGAGQLNLYGINPGIGAAVVLNEGTIVARVPFSGSGAAVGQVFNGQDVVLNSGTLALEPFIANASGNASEIASSVRAQALFNSNIYVRGDAALTNLGQAQYVRINDLTIANSAGSTAMNGNGVIALNLRSGIWVRGTTTLAPEARINGTFDGFSRATLAGPVTGAGGLIKYGNGATILLNSGNDYAGGTVVWGSTNATAVSTVGSGLRGAGTPFGTGDITVQPGGLLRIADNANIASNAVYVRSDAYGLGGVGIGHNGALPTFITTGTPSAGQIKVESTGPFDGVLALDYGYYSQDLNPSTIAGGNWWIGNSQQAEAFYFNDSIGASSVGKYLLGGGGSQSGVTFGGVLVSGARSALYEGLFSGGTAGAVRIEVGAQTADFTWNAPSFVNGNTALMTLLTRNLGLVGDVRVNTNSTLAIGNNFALGSGRLVVNGGFVRYDVGSTTNGNSNNFVTNNVTLDNDVVLQGDFNTSSAGEFVINGNVAMSEVAGVGATRIWNLTGTGAMAVGLTAGSSTNGVISGAAGSNIIKRGAQQVAFRGNNTYQGYTQIDRGEIVVSGNVLVNQNGPLGNSESPIVLGVESANNAGSLGIGGKFTIERDFVVNGIPGTGINLIRAMTNERATIAGAISLSPGTVLTLGAVAGSNATGSGGVLEVRGPISGTGRVTMGTLAAATSYGGTVALTGSVNGYGINTYSGGTTFNSTRVGIATDTYYTGPATNPTIISGPLGTGTLTLTSGENGNGASLFAIGGNRTIVNAFAATASAANATFKFVGNYGLTFTRNWDINSEASLRNRTFSVTNPYQPAVFSGNLSNTGVQGANFLKTGSGLLELNGTNTFANLLTTNGDYGTGVFIDDGILRVNGNAALGSTATLAAGGSHLAGPADIRLRGGYLSISQGFSTDRQVILTSSNGGIDVAAGQTLTLTKQTAGAFGIRKVGPGTLALNNSANTLTALTLGGGQVLNPGVGFYSATGGTVSTTATSGTPFIASGTITINSGTLSLIGGGTVQALSAANLTYGAAGAIALNLGSTTSTLTIATAFARGGAYNSVNYGTLTINPSDLAQLGTGERVMVTTGAPANTALTGGDILTVPSIFVGLAGSGQDVNFARYDATTGLREHNVTTVATLGTSAATNVADITVADVVGAAPSDVIDVAALRMSADITSFDGTQLLRINRGGLIVNGATASTLAANVLFGTGTGANLTEAIVYVRDGQTGSSAISGNVTARDFTKTGPGLLVLSGTTNVLNSNATRMPVVSVQNGTLRFANANAQFTNLLRTTVAATTGHFVLNVNEAGVFDLNGVDTLVGGLTGNGTITSGVAGNVVFASRNGFGVDTTFSGLIADGLGVVQFVRSGNGVLIMNGHASHTGGTVVQAGRVTIASGNAASLGRLEAQTVTALGTGTITLAGGDLRLVGATLLDGAQTTNDVSDGIDGLVWGGPNGYDVVVAATAVSNGVSLPTNTSSTLRAATQNALINSLTINAPQLNLTEGTVMVRGQTTFAATDTLLRNAGGTLYLQGRIDAAGKTITKVGANTTVISHTEGGVEQNSVGLWKIYGGILSARSANGGANPLGANALVELNGGSTSYGLQLLTDGDGTASAERVTTYADTTVRFGSPLAVSSDDFVSSGSSRIHTDRALSTNDDKTVVIGGLDVRGALGSGFSYFISSNSTSLWVEGGTSFERDWSFQADGTAITFNGAISGNGTLNRKSNGATVYFNAVNTYNGGTFFSGSGRNLLGSYEGNQVTLSNTAKLGTGHVFIGPLASFQINDAGNLRADQNIYVGSNLAYYGTLSLAADLTLEQVRLRAHGLGGVQNGLTDYYLSASNPSAAVLALGTIYTQALDMRTLGDGMWFLGSMTNHVGGNGSYDAATLKPGLGGTYRVGAGGGTLFFGSNGSTNVLTDVNSSAPASLVVGAPMTIQSGGPVSGGTGAVVLLQDQNYTGSTTVNRNSTLDFRGTLTTSGFEVYGTLNVAGERGTFLSGGSGANIPVTLRPGSTLRFDNTSAGVLPITAAQGRWEDSVAISLNDSVLRLQGNTAVEVAETVGAITANNGGNRIEVVRGVIGSGTELRTPSISRGDFGTVQFIHNGSQLGSDERVIITGAAPAVTNGMVAPWIISASDNQFVTYNADTGFTIAGFDRVQAAATLAASVNAPTERTIFSGNVTLNAGVDFDTYALRLDGNVALGTAADATAQLIIRSGGLIANSTRTITSGIVAGTTGSPTELLLYNNGTTTVGDFSNTNTAGQVVATGITKFGAGNFQLLGNNAGFSGDIRLQQGTVELNYRNMADVATVNVVTTIGGAGGNVVFQGAGTTLNLRAGQDGTSLNFTGNTVSFDKGIVLGDFVPVATINVDRSAGSAGTSQSKTVILTGGITFGQSNGDIGQLLRVDLRQIFNLAIHGTTTLNGRSSFSSEDAAYGSTAASTLYLRGQVTGTGGTLIKGPADSKSRNMELSYINGLNDYTGGTVLQGGTLRILARSTNVAAAANSNLVAGGLGNGDITLMHGTLDLRLDAAAAGAADTELEFVRYTSGSGVGPNLIVNGSSVINVDRNFYTGTWTRSGTTVTATLPAGHGFVNGQSILVSTGSTANTAFTITSVTGNTITYTDSAATAAGGNIVATNNSGTTKMITFNNLTIGSQMLTISGGNSYGAAIAGTTTLNGNAYFNNGVDFVLGGSAVADTITSGGGGIIFNKVGTSTLWINSTNTTGLAANVYVNAGLLAFGNRAAGSNTASLGIGDIFVNPGAQVQVRATTNINTAAGQQIALTGTAYSPAVFRAVAHLTQAQAQAIILNTAGTANPHGVLAYALETTQSNALDQSTLGNGRIYLSASSDRTYSAPSIAPGLANAANSVIGGTSTNRVYRFTHMSGNTLVINLSGTGNIGDVGGATDVQIGNQAFLGTSNIGATGFVSFQDQNTYTGQTVISRLMTLRAYTSMATGDTAGVLGANGAALVDVYGGLRIETGGSMRNNAGTANFYTNIKFHPLARLTFQDMTATGASSDRWDNSTGIDLDGSAIAAEATNNANDNSETVGAIEFDRGSRIHLINEGTGDAFLTAASISRASASSGAGSGRGTMVFVPTSSATFGAAATAGVAQTQMKFTSGPATSSTSAVTDMLPGYFIDGTGHRFVTYNATTGVVPVADGAMVPFTAGMTAGSAVVNLTATTTLPDFNPVIFALRSGGNFRLDSPTGQNNDATITFGGSGADVGAVVGTINTFTINPNLKFGATGTNEALFYAVGTAGITLNGNLTAGGVTKFGTGLLTIANDQSDAARGAGNGYQSGWVVNEGQLQFNQFGAPGNAHANNTIVLNGAEGGSAQLNLRAAPSDSLLNYRYTFGKIFAVDFATIDFDPGTNDRVHTISDIEIQQSGGIDNGPANGTLDAYLRVANNRERTILSAGTLTVASNAILNVDTTATPANFAGVASNSAYLTNSLSSGLSVAALVGSNRLSKWGDGTLYIRGNSSGFSGAMIIDQGAVHVTHNGSLGTGALVVNRYGALDVGVANFTPTNSSVTYNEGSIERWSVDNARNGTLNLGPATLQVAANQPTTSVAITLDGGGIQAFVRGDDHSGAQASGGVLRILNPNVSFVLAGDSFLGDRYYEGGNGLDSGKQTNDNRPFDETLASGAILEIQGVIGETGGPQILTKVGYDTVILSGNNTYTGGTIVVGGTLRVGIDNALAPAGGLSTTAAGVLDLNGFNQQVSLLTNVVDIASNTSTVNNGYITNSAPTLKTLTVSGAVDAIYRGVIQHNVSLAKSGAGLQSLQNNNTYLGSTSVTGGTLKILAVGAISETSGGTVNGVGATLTVDGNFGSTSNRAPLSILAGVLNGTGDGTTTGVVHGAITASGADATIRPGDPLIAGGIGLLTTSSLLTLSNSAKLSITASAALPGSPTAGTDYSFLAANAVALGSGGGRLELLGAPASVPVDTILYILNNTSSSQLGGTANLGHFANLRFNNSTFVDANNNTWAISYDAVHGTSFSGGGNDIALKSLASLTTAYWSGANGSVWDTVSPGTNWLDAIAGVDPGQTPNLLTDVFFTADGAANFANTTLGSDVSIKSLTIGTGTPAPANVGIAGNNLTLGTGGLTVQAGTTVATISSNVVLGATQTWANNGSSALTINGATVSAQNFDLTVQGAGATAISAALQLGTGGLTKSGAGTLMLSATNTYTGKTTISQGILSIAAENNLGANPTGSTADQLTLDGGTLATTATFAIDDANRGVTLGGTGGTFNVADGTTLTVANKITSGAAVTLTKSGTGRLVLSSSANDYTGTTTVTAGVLTVNGTIASAVNVTGGTFNGGVSPNPATIQGMVTVGSAGAFSAGATDQAAPQSVTGNNGNGVGQMNLGGGIEWAGGSTLVFDFSGTDDQGGTGVAGTDWDFLNIMSGTLNVTATTSNKINLFVDSWLGDRSTYGTANDFDSVNPLTAVPDRSYQWLWVQSATDIVVDSQTFGSETNLSGYFEVNATRTGTGALTFDQNTVGGHFWVSAVGTNLYINYSSVPEPGSMVLIGVAALGFAGYRRRKRKSAGDVASEAEQVTRGESAEHDAA